MWKKKKTTREKGGRFMSVHMEFRVVFPEFFQLSGLFSKAFYMVVIELIKLSLLLFCTRTMRGFYCFFFLRWTFLFFLLPSWDRHKGKEPEFVVKCSFPYLCL